MSFTVCLIERIQKFDKYRKRIKAFSIFDLLQYLNTHTKKIPMKLFVPAFIAAIGLVVCSAS